jgi:hypothetical protein
MTATAAATRARKGNRVIKAEKNSLKMSHNQHSIGHGLRLRVLVFTSSSTIPE